MIHPGTVDWIGYCVLNNWKVEIDFTQGFVFHKVSALHRLKRLLRAPEWSDWWSGGGRAGSGGRDKKTRLVLSGFFKDDIPNPQNSRI